MNSDADLEALRHWRRQVAGRVLPLDGNGAIQRRQRTVEHQQEGVADGLDFTRPERTDGGSHQAKVLLQQAQRLRFVSPSQRAVADHVGEHDRGQPPTLLCSVCNPHSLPD